MPKMLSSAQVQSFHDQGYVVIPQLFTPSEMETITQWVDEVYKFPEVPGKYMFYYEDNIEENGRVLARIENFCPYHAPFDQFVNQGKIMTIVEELFNESAVLFKEKINFKMPKGQGFTPHQDAQAGWNDYGSLFITALISIDKATPENGCLEIAGGHHQQGLIGELWKPLTAENLQGMEFTALPTQPGDGVFFDSYVPHRSAPNLTAHPRRVLYLTYNKASEGDHRVQYYGDKRKNYPPDIERKTGKTYVFKV